MTSAATVHPPSRQAPVRRRLRRITAITLSPASIRSSGRAPSEVEPDFLGLGFSDDRAAVHGRSGTWGVPGVHRLECLLARSHVVFGRKTLDHDGRTLVGVVKELDPKGHDALR